MLTCHCTRVRSRRKPSWAHALQGRTQNTEWAGLEMLLRAQTATHAMGTRGSEHTAEEGGGCSVCMCMCVCDMGQAGAGGYSRDKRACSNSITYKKTNKSRQTRQSITRRWTHFWLQNWYGAIWILVQNMFVFWIFWLDFWLVPNSFVKNKVERLKDGISLLLLI